MITGFSHIFYQKYFKNKYFIYIFIIVCLFSVSKYHVRFNEEKKFMELSNVNINLSVDAGALDEKLNGLQWITKYYPLDPQKEIDFLIEIKEYLKLDTQNKILISDYQFFSTLLNLKFSSPNKFYDGISIPNSKNKYNDDYKNFFIKKLKENKVEKIYTIGHKEYLTILSTYVLDITNNKCITSKELNEMLIIYDIKNCNL